MVPQNMLESRMHPVAQPGCAWGNTVSGWARPSVGGDRREPWVQGSQHGAACGVAGGRTGKRPAKDPGVGKREGVGGYEQLPMPQHETCL